MGRVIYLTDRRPGKMYSAVCADCGKECEVPFRPHLDRPVYCEGCWAKREGKREGGTRGASRKAEGEGKETIEREGKKRSDRPRRSRWAERDQRQG